MYKKRLYIVYIQFYTRFQISYSVRITFERKLILFYKQLSKETAREKSSSNSVISYSETEPELDHWVQLQLYMNLNMAEMTHWGLQINRVNMSQTMSSPFLSIKPFNRIKEGPKGEPVLCPSK